MGEIKELFKSFLIKEDKLKTKTDQNTSVICLTLEDLVEAEEGDGCGNCYWFKEDFGSRSNVGSCFRNPPQALIKDNLTFSARPKVLANDKPCIKFKKIKI